MAKKYHLLVIGAGSGGLVSAAGAAGLGLKVALIEKNKMGGDCLNTGCVPSKSIIRTAKVAHDARTASRFGLNDMSPIVDLGQILASVRDTQAVIEPHDSVERFESLGVDVYQGTYQFINQHQVSDGETVLQAKRFVIATGAAPFIPPIKGLSEIPYLSSDTVWNLTALPKRLVVLGGGPIGSELAQVFARLGSQVTLVERSSQLLSREDPEVSGLMAEQFNAEGIDLMTGWSAEEVSGAVANYQVRVSNEAGESKEIPFDQILVAVGRAPHVNHLGLDKIGVAYTRRGISVDAYLRSSQKHIYACGDVAGPYQFTHTADFQARLILRNAFFPGKSKIDYRVVPWCTFTDPEVARVGLNETEANKQGIPYDVFRYELKDLDRAICEREREGFIKVLTKPKGDQLLGAMIVGAHAGDVVHELVLAMQAGIGLKQIAATIHIYPTLAEACKRIADTYQRSRLTTRSKQWLQRYFTWRFG